MKTRHIFSLAVLALMMAACSSDEIAQQQSAPSTGKVPFKAVINADAAGTRGLTEATDGKSITAKWEKDELVAVVHGKIVDVLSVESVDASTGAATVTGEITSATNGESVQVVYAGHEGTMVNGIKSDIGVDGRTTDITKAEITEAVTAALDTQDGTLDCINKTLDYRYGEAKLAVSNGTATFEATPSLTLQFAIIKVSLTTNGSTALAAKKLVMKKGTVTDLTIDLGTSTKSTFYIAFEPEGTSYTFEATDADDKDYSCTLSLTSASAPKSGYFYTATLTMKGASAGNYRVYTAKDTYTDEAIPSTATTLTGTVTPGNLAAGTYVVSGTATCAGDLKLTGDVDLILLDGASLTMTGGIAGDEYTLNIYGQTEGTGELSAKGFTSGGSTGIAIDTKNLNVHGGKITISTSDQGIETGGTFTVYNGTINTTGTYNGIMALGPMNVYGGDITASSTSDAAISLYKADGNDNCNLTITGGKVTATNTGSAVGIAGSDNTVVTISGGELTVTGGDGAPAFGANTNISLVFPVGMALYNASSDPIQKAADGAYDNIPPDLRYIVIK